MSGAAVATTPGPPSQPVTPQVKTQMGFSAPPPTPLAAAAPLVGAEAASYASYAAHYEKENQALQEQALGLRQLLEQKEVQASHLWQLLSMASHEGDLLATRLGALLPAHPQIATTLWQAEAAVPMSAPLAAASPYAATPQQPVPPPSTPLTGMATPRALLSATPLAAALENAAQPATPSRMVLKLNSVTPGPMSGTYAGPPPVNLFPPAGVTGALGLTPVPAAALTPTASPPAHIAGEGVPTPRRLPSSAPPAHEAPNLGDSPERPAPPTSFAFGSPLVKVANGASPALPALPPGLQQGA